MEAPKTVTGEELLRMREKESKFYLGTLEDHDDDPLWDRWAFDQAKYEAKLRSLPPSWRRKETCDFWNGIKDKHEH